MIAERIKEICDARGTNMTSLCREITGSSGNTSTWKKDKVRSDWLREICKKLSVSADYLLELSENQQINTGNNLASDSVNYSYPKNDFDWMSKINKLPVESQYELKGYLNRLLEETSPTSELKQAK